eukprot:TRINITY_DN7381_c0_g1_i2.p1 TRINITY_DN7381_c0_g1~~TRINITY_DN7381_c0_g1_i2.p1  ORF type:complete len:359 (-),score=74.72 TRINITY_DN7381_c0_g1_i2:77-1027(-)
MDKIVEVFNQTKTEAERAGGLDYSSISNQIFVNTSSFSVEQLNQLTAPQSGPMDEVDYFDEDVMLDDEDDLDEEEAVDEGYSDDEERSPFGRRHGVRLGGSAKIVMKTVEWRGRDGIIMRKRIRVIDPDEPIVTRMPNREDGKGLPISWALPIQPYKPEQPCPESTFHTTASILGLDSLSHLVGSDFKTIVIDPPWGPQFGIEQLKKLKINDKLIRAGLMYIWCEKENIPAVLEVANSWNFNYVENITWVQRNVNNTFRTGDSDYFHKSKLTCLMCRKRASDENKNPIGLMHQRNPDVVFDFMRKTRTGLLGTFFT